MTINGGSGTSLTIDGANMTLMGPCPMFIFNDIESITMHSLTISCTSTTLPSTAPAILIQQITKTVIDISSITVSGYVQTAVLVLGGVFTTIVPTLHADLSGSSFSNIVVSNSYYRLHMELALALYYGRIDVGGMNPVTTQMIVQPARNPNTGFITPLYNSTSGTAPMGITIFNMTEWTRLFGLEYEVIANDPHGTLGFSLIETDELNVIIMRNAITYLFAAGIIILVRYAGVVNYLMTLAKASQ